MRGLLRVGVAAVGLCAGCAPPAPPAADPADAALAPWLARTVAARGLDFRDPVRLRELEPADVPARLALELDRVLGPDEWARDVALKSALGLVPEGTDLRAELLDFQAAAVVGFYTPLERVLYLVTGPGGRVAGAPGDPLGGILVHELAHVLQDMHSALPEVTLGLVDDEDLVFALGALLEGDATWTSFRDAERHHGEVPLSEEELGAEMAALGAQAARAGTPLWIREMVLQQYRVGYRLALALVARGGVAALDAALADPPLSSEEVLHPERYLEGRRPLAWLALPDPPGDCSRRAANRLGELGVRIWLREAGVDPAEARAAAEGWDGDRAVLWSCARGPAFAWLIQLDDATDARELEAVARRAMARPSAAGARAARIDAGPRRVLLSAGLSAPHRSRLLASAERRLGSLAAYLALRPDVIVRARTLRGALP